MRVLLCCPPPLRTRSTPPGRAPHPRSWPEQRYQEGLAAYTWVERKEDRMRKSASCRTRVSSDIDLATFSLTCHTSEQPNMIQFMQRSSQDAQALPRTALGRKDIAMETTSLESYTSFWSLQRYASHASSPGTLLHRTSRRTQLLYTSPGPTSVSSPLRTVALFCSRNAASGSWNSRNAAARDKRQIPKDLRDGKERIQPGP
jgi:hypothetical protein